MATLSEAVGVVDHYKSVNDTDLDLSSLCHMILVSAIEDIFQELVAPKGIATDPKKVVKVLQ